MKKLGYPVLKYKDLLNILKDDFLSLSRKTRHYTDKELKEFFKLDNKETRKFKIKNFREI